MSTHAPSRGRLHVVSRVAAALLGGWAFTWGAAVLGITAAVALGARYEDAYTGVMLLAFLVFLSVFCWSFAAASVARVWAVLAGSAVLTTAAAWLLQRTLV